MTPAAFHAAREALRYTTRALAVELGCARSLITGWEAGKSAVPPIVAEWLEARLASEEALPAPRGWQSAGAVPHNVTDNSHIQS